MDRKKSKDRRSKMRTGYGSLLILEPFLSQETPRARPQNKDFQPRCFSLPHQAQDVGLADEHEFLTVQFDVGCSVFLV